MFRITPFSLIALATPGAAPAQAPTARQITLADTAHRPLDRATLAFVVPATAPAPATAHHHASGDQT